MSLLLTSRKKSAEENTKHKQVAERQPFAASPSVATSTASSASSPSSVGDTADTTSVGFDAIAASGKEKSAGDIEKPIGAAEVLRAGGDNEMQKGGVFRTVAVSFVALIVICGGGYGLLLSNLISGDKVSSIFSLSGGGTPIIPAPSVSNSQVAQPLITSDSESLPLPKPKIDVQSGIDFAAFIPPSDVALSTKDGEKDYVEQIPVQMGHDVLPEQAEGVEIAVADDGLGEVIAADENSEETVEIVRTAEASRDSKKVIDALTASEELIREGVIVHSQTAAPIVSVAEMQTTDMRQNDTAVSLAEINVLPSMNGMARRKLLQQAKSLYVKGSYTEAESLYRSVLVKNPTNIDALHGLALVAVASGRYQLAVATYLQVLDYYPSDPVSIADLTNLTNLHGASGQNFYETESALKKLIGRHQEWDSRLYFALGNVYAANSRWLEAQRSYFEAHAREQNNPDYAYNLAVVLDYLNKREMAVEYYHMALDLASQSPSGFDAGRVRTRIDHLNK